MKDEPDRSTNYQADSLSLIGAIALGTGVMIGAGIFALTGQMAEMTGSLFPLAFLSAALIVSFSAYSNTGPADLEVGEEIVYPAETLDVVEAYRKVFVSPDAGFVRWLDILENPGNDPATVFINTDGEFVPSPAHGRRPLLRAVHRHENG